MQEFHHSQEALARAVGKSRSHVANMMRLLGASEKVRAYLEEGKLTAGHARALIGADRADALADEIVERGLNVRQTEALVTKPARSAKTAPARDADILALERDLAGLLGLNVRLKTRGQSGEVTIRYRTLDQLDHLLKRLR
jgi:ParB family chromosome partitioning protein